MPHLLWSIIVASTLWMRELRQRVVNWLSKASQTQELDKWTKSIWFRSLSVPGEGIPG